MAMGQQSHVNETNLCYARRSFCCREPIDPKELNLRSTQLGGGAMWGRQCRPCDSTKRGETKSSGLEGATYKHTMVSRLASEESVGYHQATFGVVARLKAVAWRPALRLVHHASLDAVSGTASALHFTK